MPVYTYELVNRFRSTLIGEGIKYICVLTGVLGTVGLCSGLLIKAAEGVKIALISMGSFFLFLCLAAICLWVAMEYYGYLEEMGHFNNEDYEPPTEAEKLSEKLSPRWLAALTGMDHADRKFSNMIFACSDVRKVLAKAGKVSDNCLLEIDNSTSGGIWERFQELYNSCSHYNIDTLATEEKIKKVGEITQEMENLNLQVKKNLESWARRFSHEITACGCKLPEVFQGGSALEYEPLELESDSDNEPSTSYLN